MKIEYYHNIAINRKDFVEDLGNGKYRQ